jgi:hypothetical protein
VWADLEPFVHGYVPQGVRRGNRVSRADSEGVGGQLSAASAVDCPLGPAPAALSDPPGSRRGGTKEATARVLRR